jgi:ABC-2 type transport system permease protein
MRISVVVLLVLSVGGAIAAARLSDRTPTDQIGLVGARSAALGPAIRLQSQAAGRRVHLHELASAATAARAVRDGTVAVALVDGNRLLVKSSRSQAPVRAVQDAVTAAALLSRLRDTGLTQAQALKLLTPTPLPIDVLEPNARNVDRNRGLIAIGLIALFTVLVFYGQAVAQGVTEEKSSRVVELLLTTLTPRRLLAGKVLGIGTLGLVQLLLAGIAALLAGKLAGGVGLPPAAPKAVALVVLWFVLGYAFYSVAFAATGALVSRQEDLTAAMLPINFVLIGAFYLALILINGNPNGTFATIAAFLPPLSPMLVPARMVLGDMTAIELAAAIVIDLVATAWLVVLAGRIYERAILQVGAPLRVHRLLRSDQKRPVFDPRTPPTSADPLDLRRRRLVDTAARAVVVAFLIAGVAIGLEHAVAIVLMVLGLLLVVLLETRRHGGHRGAH